MSKQYSKPKTAATKSARHAFIAEHRGGPLAKALHQQLMAWSIACVEHVLHILPGTADQRLLKSLEVAKKWQKGTVATGLAMKASLQAHTVARQSKNEQTRCIARAAGQATATAHMADHSLGGAFYALKAVKEAGGNVAKEHRWQQKKLATLAPGAVKIVEEMWARKELDRRI